MKISYGSKRANMVREVLYLTVLLRALEKLDNYSFVAVILGVVGGYLTNRILTDKKEDKDVSDKRKDQTKA